MIFFVSLQPQGANEGMELVIGREAEVRQSENLPVFIASPHAFDLSKTVETTSDVIGALVHAERNEV